MLQKILKIISQHKFITFIIILLIAGGGYFGYKTLKGNKEATRYLTAAVESGTLIVSVSGSGQVSALNQEDIKPKVSGEILAIYVEKDQGVKTGHLIAELDSKNAQQTISDAENNLENAIFALNKLETLKEEAKADLVKAHEDAFNAVSDVFGELPSMMDKMENIFTKSSYNSDQSDIDYYKHIVGFYTGQSFPLHEQESYYLRLHENYNEIWKHYQSITVLSPTQTIENLLEETYNIVKQIAELSRSARDTILFYKNILQNQSLTPPISISITDSQLTNLTNITNSLNQKVANLLSITQTINKGKDSITNYERDIQSQQFTINQKENSLLDAKEKFAYYFIRAPLDGAIAKINVKKGDSVSSATILVTLITRQKIAEISLNEVDVAKVKVGQKASLTFDALPDVSSSGKVIEVDTVGTVTQGVVSYGVKIALDTEDERIKPAMSVTADIITDAKQDVVLVPNSAVKYQNNIYYVEVIIDNSTSRSQTVEIGISNDTMTEIISGLKEGDIVVTSTISPSAVQTTQTQKTQTPGFQIPGMGGQQMKNLR